MRLLLLLLYYYYYYIIKLSLESSYKFRVPVDANVSVEVVVTRKSNTIRNFPCTVLQCPVVLTSLKASRTPVEVVVTRKSNTIRNFPRTVLQCPVGATRGVTVSTSAFLACHQC